MHSPLGEGPAYSKHIPALPGQVGGGGSNKKCGQKKISKKYDLIYQDQMF